MQAVLINVKMRPYFELDVFLRSRFSSGKLFTTFSRKLVCFLTHTAGNFWWKLMRALIALTRNYSEFFMFWYISYCSL